MGQRQTGRRLLRYANIYKKTIWLALLLLALSVVAELAGPLIAKRIIDDHIVGIERPWHETDERSSRAVAYNGSWYQRADRFEPGETKGREVRLLQAGRAFYFIGEPVGHEGKRTYSDGRITIEHSGGSSSYPAQRVTLGELSVFYKPELISMLKLSAFYFGLVVVSALFAYGQRYMLQVSANRIIRTMRGDVFAHIQRLPVRYFDNLPAGKIVSRVTNDTEAIRELYVSVLANFFSGLIYIAGIYAALFLLDARLALVSLPLLPLLYVWIVIYRRFAARYNHRIRSRLSDINGIINEAIQGMPIIRAFGRQKQTTAEFEELNNDYFTYRNKLLSLDSLTSHNLVGLLRNALFLVVIWMFAGGSLSSALTIGVLYAYIDYMNRLFQPIVGIVTQLSNLETARVSAERVFELMDEPGEEQSFADLPRYRGDVRFDNVSFSYKPGEDVLRDISFAARHGETVALVGHTGSGKSSVMNLLLRFYDVERGSITVDGRDVRDVPKQQLRRHMGIVLQEPYLFTGTIAANVSLNEPSISRDDVERALRAVGAYEMFAGMPKGIDEPVSEKGATLSAGQRQLISFARALAFNPAILILDEATASIDTETEAVIQRALEVLQQGRTTFVIAHRLSTIRQADQIIVLDHGRLAESGDHDSLMQRQGLYWRMYQLQQNGQLQA